jgi:exopolysaccharide biosynthesis polyprenyl glycosylphosphotransferase
VAKPIRRSHVVALAVFDLLAINAAFATAYWLRYRYELGGEIEWFNDVPYGQYAPWGMALSAILVGLIWVEGLYGRRRTRSRLAVVYGLANVTIVAVALLTILIFGIRPTAQSRLMLIYAAVLIVAALSLTRAVDGVLRQRRRQRGDGVLRALIVGAGDRGRAVMSGIVAQRGGDYHGVGFLDDDPEKRAQAIGRFPALGATTDLPAVLDREAVDLVILALPWSSRDRIVHLVNVCEASGVNVRIVPDLFQLTLNRVDLDSFYGIPLIAVRQPVIGGWQLRAKRALDVALAALLLTLTAPLTACIAIAVRLESAGPVLFRQVRVGRNGTSFTCLKFRSMTPDAERERRRLEALNEASGPLFKIRDDPRLTRVGRVIRRLSLDELPQLWNVLRGDMSLVGPRPPMPAEVDAYEDWHLRRLEVAPGLTGLWQVSGRSELTFDEMVMLDLYYAENWSLGLDVQILLRTIPTVLRGTGAY